MLTTTGASAMPATPAIRRFDQWVADPGAASVPQVRARVRATLSAWAVPLDVTDVLLLAVSELVGNVVRHVGAGRMRVGVASGAGWLRLDVADQGAGLPRLPAPRVDADPASEGGRGLLVVQLMAAELGGGLCLVVDEFGKTVRLCVPAARIGGRVAVRPRPEAAPLS
ncbi:ATP-binding protein [Streptomyces sp. PCS3-D2]|uniref:ATP-binding protein n=1 Tax=Streptomyces sp. PCS3-D2 TaxID=1460244 RepID=UPI000451A1FD|nr:ATP-binding protein [Streptomyces sp. PCS3-D2]WKV75682.1 ATP-binding protein [Streptomyces sp. PCS3-D2]